MGREWKRKCPQAENADIRLFLDAFIDGFGFKRQERLKFSPEDKVMDVYRALYPTPGWPDGMELETFALILKKTYGFDLAAVMDYEVTLGELFEKARSAR